MLFSDPAARQELMEKYIGKLDQAKAMRDTRAVLAFLANQPAAAPGKIGAIGYCMGGRMALAAAGHFPERFAAVAAYHPGHLATDAPDSPHLLAPKIQARVYVGGARPDEMDWHVLTEPGWFLEQGWALTPETAGIAARMTTFDPDLTWSRVAMTSE